MLIKLICCDVFTRIACSLIAHSPHIVDVEFVPMLAHNEPKKLRADIQARINRCVTERRYESIALGFGLCGNAATSLTASVPMIIPRMHDCCTMFMGSKGRFLEAFGGALSTRWCSSGYYERGYIDGRYMGVEEANSAYRTSLEYMGYVEQYGEENADYIWETMHPDIETEDAVYIHIEGHEHSGSFEFFKSDVEGRGKALRIVEGDISFLRALIDGDWDEKRFLRVEPGQRVIAVYDMDTVMTAE